MAAATAPWQNGLLVSVDRRPARVGRRRGSVAAHTSDLPLSARLSRAEETRTASEMLSQERQGDEDQDGEYNHGHGVGVPGVVVKVRGSRCHSIRAKAGGSEGRPGP